MLLICCGLLLSLGSLALILYLISTDGHDDGDSERRRVIEGRRFR